MTEPAAKHCPFCEKQGLPILPLRYAVARTDFDSDHPSWKALDLPPTFGHGVTDIALPASAAKYTARLLRPGYLYVFNEVRGEWAGYLVTGRGFLYEFDVEDVTPPNPDTIEFSCYRTGEEYIARCITIPDAANAGAVWLGFSDTAWTPAVLEKHRSASYREKHMRKIDASGGYVGEQHTAALTELVSVVNEFAEGGPVPGVPGEARRVGSAVDPDTGESTPLYELPGVAIYSYPTFDYSPHEFSGLKHEASGLVEWASQAAGSLTPLLVALDDPAAVTQELGSLIQTRYSELISDPEVERKLSVSTAIQQIEAAVKNQAELTEMAAAEQLAANQMQHESWLLNSAVDAIFDTDLTERSTQRIERLGTVTPQELDRAVEMEWQRYTAKYDEDGRSAWQRAFDAKLKALDAQVLSPLAKAHRTWISGDCLARSMECNYDPHDIDSGVVYAHTVLLCLMGTQDKQVCFDQYLEWLESNSAKDVKNLVLRAMLYNHEPIIEKVQEQLDQTVDPRILSWPSLIGLYDRSLAVLTDDGKAIAAHLVEQLMGPLMKALDRAAESQAVRAVGLALGLVARRAVVSVTETGSKKRFRAALIRQMLRLQANGVEISQHQMQRAVSAELRRLQARGISMQGNGRQTWTLMVDPDRISQIPAHVSGQTRANQLARSLMTPTQFEDSEIARWRRVIDTDVRLGAVGSVLEALCLTKLWKDVAEAMPHEQNEANRRFGVGVIATISSTTETTGKFLKNRFAGSLRYARLSSTGRIMTKLGGRAAVIAGVVMAVFDGVKAIEEYGERNYGMAIAYIGSAVLGVGLIIALAIGGPVAIALGAILLALLFGITILIEHFKDNKFQDWLERCHEWGKLTSQRYPDLELEMNALEKAYSGA